MKFWLRTVSACVALAMFPTASVRGEDGPSADVPELKALEYYAGDWDVVIAPNQPNEPSPAKGRSKATWTMKGRFLEQAGTLKLTDGQPDLEMTSLMTYDSKKKVYRMWTFVSNGTTTEAEGTWNATAKTMTSLTKPDENGQTTTIVADFSTVDVERWKFIIKDRAGQVQAEVKGQNNRHKE